MTGRIVTIGDCTLYLGDCREILPTIGKVDAVVTDPPYGIGEAAGKNASRAKLRHPGGARNTTGRKIEAKDYGVASWDDTPVDPALLAMVLAAARHAILFGGNYYALPPTSCWLVWDKLNGDSDFADCELAWTNLPKAVRRFRYMWNGMLRANNEPRGDHPTQKPVGVMSWCLRHLPGFDGGGLSIIDPFMGSGTTGVACAMAGFKFIGIEREAVYFDAACRRIDEAYRQPRLIEAPGVPPPSQPAFDLGGVDE